MDSLNKPLAKLKYTVQNTSLGDCKKIWSFLSTNDIKQHGFQIITLTIPTQPHNLNFTVQYAKSYMIEVCMHVMPANNCVVVQFIEEVA